MVAVSRADRMRRGKDLEYAQFSPMIKHLSYIVMKIVIKQI